MTLAIIIVLAVCFRRQIADAIAGTFRGLLFTAGLMLGPLLVVAFLAVGPAYAVLREALWGILPSPRSPVAGMTPQQRYQWANRLGPHEGN